MAYRLQSVTESDLRAEIMDSKVGVKTFGDYNRMPTPWKPCSEHEYIHWSKIYSPQFIEHRQVYDLDGNSEFYGKGAKMNQVTIYWFHDRAYAIEQGSHWETRDGEIVYTDPIRCFRVGCEHTDRELTQAEVAEKNIRHFGSCYHVLECTECGRVTAYDSSD